MQQDELMHVTPVQLLTKGKPPVGQVAHEVVAGNDTLEAPAGEVGVALGGGAVHAIFRDAQPLHQRLNPLLCGRSRIRQCQRKCSGV